MAPRAKNDEHAGEQRPVVQIEVPWNAERPRVMVVACSDGRLQEATDEFLARHLNIRHYDRLYLPGGGGALSPSGRDYFRAHQVQQECRLLVDVHGVEQLVVLFHGPAADGPLEAICADYRRKFAWATTDQVRSQQERDAHELVVNRWKWAGSASMHIYRCEVNDAHGLSFATLHADPVP